MLDFIKNFFSSKINIAIIVAVLVTVVMAFLSPLGVVFIVLFFSFGIVSCALIAGSLFISYQRQWNIFLKEKATWYNQMKLSGVNVSQEMNQKWQIDEKKTRKRLFYKYKLPIFALVLIIIYFSYLLLA